MKYCVTGAAGFIGSNLVEEILKRGDQVLGVDSFVTGHEENIEEFRSDPNFEFMHEDITSAEVCKQVCFRADYVLHQAALGSVPRSVEQPLYVNDNNVRSTIQMLTAARDAGVKRFVFASSASIYGDIDRFERKCDGNVIETTEYIADLRDENMGRAPANPYAISKLACEEYVKLFKPLYGLQTIALRYFNVFGPRQSPEGQYAAVVPKFIDAMQHNRTVLINGDGKQFRDFTFVENVVNANLLACQAEENSCGQFYNVGAGGRTTITELYFELANLLMGNEKEVEFGPARAGDVFGSIADLNRVRTCLKYEPTIGVKEGLRRTVEWYNKRQS